MKVLQTSKSRLMRGDAQSTMPRTEQGTTPHTEQGITPCAEQGTMLRTEQGMRQNMNLKEALEGREYIIRYIETDDEELSAFLFSLGCYSGESITVVSHLKGGCVVSIKDGRYNIDNRLAEIIFV